MRTQTNSNKSNGKPQSFWTNIKAAVIGTFLIIGGFLTILFLFLLSAIMLPLTAFRLWTLQKQFKAHSNATIIEGEYTVTENAKDHS